MTAREAEAANEAEPADQTRRRRRRRAAVANGSRGRAAGAPSEAVDAGWDGAAEPEERRSRFDALGASARSEQGPRPTLDGWAAIAAAATALFAPLAILQLTLTGAPLWTVAPAAFAAAPLAALAGVATARPVDMRAFALAHAPIALAAAWLIWASGGLASPIAPWLFAASAAAAFFGGPRGALAAAALATACAAAAALIPEPADPIITFAPPPELRKLAILASWTAAAGALAAAAWAAQTAWARALPPLRHPTIAARQALSRLVEDAGAAALRIDAGGVVRQVVGAPAAAFDGPTRELLGLRVADIAHPDDRAALENLLAEGRLEAEAAARREAAWPEDVADREPSDANAAGTIEQEGARTALLRVRSRFGGHRWVEARAASAAGYPRPAGRGAATTRPRPGDVALVVRARRRGASNAQNAGSDVRADLLANVHEGLRTELTSVVGYAEILKNEIFGPLGAERYRDYARRAYGGGAHLLELVDELLELAAVDAGRVGADAALIDPVPVIDGAARLARRRAERRGVKIVAAAPPTTPHMRSDRRAMRRVLVNLLIDCARRARVGDVIRLGVDSEPGAIAFTFTIIRPSGARDGAVDADYQDARFDGDATAQDLVEDAEILDAAAEDEGGGDRQDDAEEAAARAARHEADLAELFPGRGPEADAVDGDAAGVTPLGEARLGRLVALSLVERLGGGALFADGDDMFDTVEDLAPGERRQLLEILFPLGDAAAAAATGDAPGARRRLFAPSTPAPDPAEQARAARAKRAAPRPAPNLGDLERERDRARRAVDTSADPLDDEPLFAPSGSESTRPEPTPSEAGRDVNPSTASDASSPGDAATRAAGETSRAEAPLVTPSSADAESDGAHAPGVASGDPVRRRVVLGRRREDGGSDESDFFDDAAAADDIETLMRVDVTLPEEGGVEDHAADRVRRLESTDDDERPLFDVSPENDERTKQRD